METNMTRNLRVALAVASLVGCTGDEDDNTSGGSAQDIASEGAFPPECGSPNATSDLNHFEYEVVDMDGCNDVQAYTFSFDWTDGPVLVVNDDEFEFGDFEVSLTTADGAGLATFTHGDSESTIWAYTCDDRRDGLIEPGEAEIRLVFDQAQGIVALRVEEQTEANVMCDDY